MLWVLADHQGRVTDVIDSAAALVQYRKYQLFNNLDITAVADFVLAFIGHVRSRNRTEAQVRGELAFAGGRVNGSSSRRAVAEGMGPV